MNAGKISEFKICYVQWIVDCPGYFSRNGFVMVEPSVDIVYTSLLMDKTIIPEEGEIHKYLTVTSVANIYAWSWRGGYSGKSIQMCNNYIPRVITVD